MDEEIRNLLCQIYANTKKKLQEHWRPKMEQYGDIFQLVRWRPGDQLYPPHADAAYEDGSPHPFSYREYAAIIYLNDSYSGGQLYFSKLNFVPEITTGTLAIFPGTLEYTHGVTPVRSGMRYTIAGFFTSQKSYANQYLI